MNRSGTVARPARFPWQRRRWRQNIAGYLFIAPWLIGFVIFTAGAMITSAGLSFYQTDMLSPGKFVGLQNFQTLFTDDSLWWKSLFNTAYYTFALVPIYTILALLIAMLLNQRIVGRDLFRSIYYLPAVVSGVAVSILWIWIFHPYYGLLNGALSVVGIHGPAWLNDVRWAMPALIIMGLWGAGGSMIIFLAGLQGVPASLYEAAKIDGAGTLSCFRHVTLPMMTPTIFFSVIMGIIGAFQMFTQAYVTTHGGPNNATMTAVLAIYSRAFQQFRFGYASAMAWVLFAVILVFTLLIVRSGTSWVYYEGELKG